MDKSLKYIQLIRVAATYDWRFIRRMDNRKIDVLVSRNNVHSRIWPRASAAAERLWSSTKPDEYKAAQRLEEHACRMNRRGISAQPPNGPGFCVM